MPGAGSRSRSPRPAPPPWDPARSGPGAASPLPGPRAGSAASPRPPPARASLDRGLELEDHLLEVVQALLPEGRVVQVHAHLGEQRGDRDRGARTQQLEVLRLEVRPFFLVA